MTKKRLTDLVIRQLPVPQEGQVTHFDAALAGFGVRVSQGGSKSFVVLFGKRRKLKTLGHYPAMQLAEARKQAKRLQGEAEGDPRVIASITFVEAVERFILDTKSRTKPATYTAYERLLLKHFPFKKPLSAITRADIMSKIEGIKEAPSTAQHVYVAIRTLMNWAVRLGLLNSSPVPAMRYSQSTRSRILSGEELQVVWRRADIVGYPFGTVVKLLILTGQRRGEIAGLRRSWIDNGVITYPKGFCKNGREHRIPIGALAAEVIDGIPNTGDLLFPARGKPDQALNGWGKAKKQFDETVHLAPWTLHDLRRTFSSQLASLGTPIHVTEKLLNHVSGTVSGVAAVYNRYSYAAEMRTAVEAFETRLKELLAKTA